ncbi:MAG: Na(+)-translocating NADH-quinone reductase subunit C [Pseudomonadota bacterium]
MSDENDTQTDLTTGSDKKPGLLRRFIDLPSDSVPKTVFVAVSLCLVASMAVSATAVSLRPQQSANEARNEQINILQVAGLYDPSQNVEEAFQAFEPHVLNLSNGTFSDEFDPATFDDLAAADDPDLSRALDNDPAAIGRQALYRTVYLLRDDAGDIDKVILPVHGYGLWSTLYGYIALEEDANEIFGLQFYQHAETPGLGAEVDNPRWRALWRGKRLADDEGEIQITVAKSPPAAGEDFYINALSGATLTSVGVDNLVRFWMGDEGYGPFLSNIQSGVI